MEIAVIINTKPNQLKPLANQEMKKTVIVPSESHPFTGKKTQHFK